MLLKLLETNAEVTVNAAAISEAWPADREKPSARAISERFVKIRQLAKAAGAGTFSIGSAPSTPQKGATGPAKAKDSSGTKRKRGGKAKRGTRDENAEDDEEYLVAKVSKKEAIGLQEGLRNAAERGDANHNGDDIVGQLLLTGGEVKDEELLGEDDLAVVDDVVTKREETSEDSL